MSFTFSIFKSVCRAFVHSCSKVMGFIFQMHIWSIVHQYFEASFKHDIYQVIYEDDVKFHMLMIIRRVYTTIQNQ